MQRTVEPCRELGREPRRPAAPSRMPQFLNGRIAATCTALDGNSGTRLRSPRIQSRDRISACGPCPPWERGGPPPTLAERPAPSCRHTHGACVHSDPHPQDIRMWMERKHPVRAEHRPKYRCVPRHGVRACLAMPISDSFPKPCESAITNESGPRHVRLNAYRDTIAPITEIETPQAEGVDDRRPDRHPQITGRGTPVPEQKYPAESVPPALSMPQTPRAPEFSIGGPSHITV